MTPNGQGYVDLFTAPPVVTSVFGSAPIYSYCGYAGCTPGDFQRSNFLIRTPSVLDGTKAEIPMFVNYSVETGKLTTWANGTSYPVGAIVNNMTSGNLYRATTGGTSASTGTGPSGTGSAIQDGSVVWKWEAFGQVDAKIAVVFETVKRANAGNTWGFVNNLVMDTNAPKQLAIGAELDLGNFSGPCDIDGQSFCSPLWLFGHTGYISTAAMVISTGADASVTAYHFGIWFQRAANGNLVKDATIADDTSSDIGIGFGQTAGRLASHATATIRDLSTSNVGLFMAGAYQNSVLNTEFADIAANDALPTAIRMKSGHAACWNGSGMCAYFDAGANRLRIWNSGQVLFSVDTSGNAYVKNNLFVGGSVTPQATGSPP